MRNVFKTNKTMVLTITSHKQSRMAIDFCKGYKIDYIENNVVLNGLSREQVIYIVNRAGGFENILAERSKLYKDIKKILDDENNSTTSDVISFITKNPRVLKYPIMFDNRRFLAGYSEDDIRMFLPRKLKMQLFYRDLDRADKLVTM
ncbi:ArsC/Spx/MgsR family protein [Viridibacillus arvi]|uniref:ArsC/Spx/MgsR family protein n=1 Tax=Viridibacillus arvi TaxID=263475 RepID=UPI0034CF2DE7